jgi:hypothetical protein
MRTVPFFLATLPAELLERPGCDHLLAAGACEPPVGSWLKCPLMVEWSMQCIVML